MFKRLALLSLLLCPFALPAAPAITVSGNSVTVLGSAQTISLTCTLIDPNNTGNLRSGSNIITTFITSTATPSNVATCGPIYGNDVITDGYGNANTTYYKVAVFTVSGGIIASTPSLQQFYAFTGNGTIDLATATPLAPSFFTGPGGSVSIPGTFTTGNINAVQWAGPGATPTIDQAVTACGANPCTVYISATYSGAESTSLFTTSLGYKVYGGANNVTIVDLRANAATPGNPGAAPLYPIVWGGREAGSLQRLAVNNWTGGTIPDSTGGASFFNWISGTFPTDNGQLAGSYNIGIVHDAVTVGASTSVVSGSDHEIHLDATSSDGPIPYAAAVTAQALISRTNATQNVTTAADYRASVCQNSSTSGAAITNCYGFDAPISGAGAGSTRNYGFHDGQGTLYENNLRIDAVDSGGTPRHFIFFRGDNGIDFQPLADASGWTFKTQAGSGAFRIIPNSIISSLIAHQFSAGMSPASAAGTDVGTASLPFANLWLGTAATNNFKLAPAATTGARTVNIPDPLQATTTLPLVIANGTLALNTASITTATCDVGKAATATGTLSTDAVDWSFNAAPTATNKYGAFLVVYAVPSANTVTFYTCNPSATTSTPTAMTVNWSVRRP